MTTDTSTPELSTPIKVAVILGGHPIDVPAFTAMLRSFSDVDPYVQNLEDFTADFGNVAGSYDVVLFYNFNQFDPKAELPWYQSSVFDGLENLGRKGQGLLVFHHAGVALAGHALWDQITGLRSRSLKPHFDQTVTTHVVDPDHPITQGLKDWTMTGEVYEMANALPEDGNHTLLTTDHPDSCTTLAWTRTFRDSNVFCYLAGHDHEALDHPSVRRTVHRGIRWLAGRVE